MRHFKALLPHLSIALSLALLVLGILNEFNPRAGFLQGNPPWCCSASAPSPRGRPWPRPTGGGNKTGIFVD